MTKYKLVNVDMLKTQFHRYLLYWKENTHYIKWWYGDM